MALPVTMKAVVYDRFGDASVARLADNIPVPKISPNEVLVQVYYASLNPVDHKLREGLYGFALRWSGFPKTIGRDFSGVIVQVGSKVEGFAVGDEVLGALFTFSGDGSFAQYVKVTPAFIGHKPPSVSFADAATIPIGGLTAWQALVDIGKVKKDSVVVINGASGGIGTFAVQFAKYKGAYVYAVCSGANVELVKSLGADKVIDYKTTDFTKEIHDADIVLNGALIGGEGVRKNLSVLKAAGGGVVLDTTVAPISSNTWTSMIRDIVSLVLTIGKGWFGYNTFKAVFMKNNGPETGRIATLMAQGAVKAVIDKVYALEEYPAAMTRLETSSVRGKLLLRVATDAP